MIIYLSFFYYCLATILVFSFKFFGSSVNSLVGGYTIMTVLLSFFLGIVFKKIKLVEFQIDYINKKLFNRISICISIVIVIILIVCVKVYGNPPVIYKIMGQDPPIEILFAKYRDRLPLRAFLPPLCMINFVCVMLINKNKENKLAIIMGCVSLICFVLVYDTRHIVIWAIMYLVLMNFLNLKRLKNINKKLLFKFILVIMVFFFLFVYAGNSRVNLTREQSKIFAISMGIDLKYINLPIEFIWIIIYAFSNLTNGIVNDFWIKPFNGGIIKGAFPGFLQRILSCYDSGDYPNKMFVRYAYGMDGWHSIALELGYVTAIVLVIFLMILIIYFSKIINSKMAINEYCDGMYYVILVFFASRLMLLPIANYILDFAAFDEFIFLILLFKIAGIKIRKI